MVKRDGYWQKHPKKELQALLFLFDDQTWKITDPPKYYKVYCPCPDKHKTWVHLSPSGANYVTDKEHWLQRQPCYNKYKREATR